MVLSYNHPSFGKHEMGKSADALIVSSKEENRTVHAQFTESLATDLLIDADGSSETAELAEFWGDACEEHASWRVVLHKGANKP